MTPVETQLREEIANVLHNNWVFAVRSALAAVEPLMRGAARRPDNQNAWNDFDRLFALSNKKWDCLRDEERFLVLAQADEVLALLRDLGELKP